MDRTGTSRLDLFRRAASPEGAALLDELRRLASEGRLEALTPAMLGTLRSQWSADLLDSAIELTRARLKAQVKFPERDDLLADLPGVEQATSQRVAAHKAKRFAALDPPPRRIVDLCCGIGGDAMSLARVAPLTAIDIDETRTWMASWNAECTGRVADVERLDLERDPDLVGSAYHIDPARREAGPRARRLWRLEDYQPGPAFLRRLVDTLKDGAIKLGPGVDLDSLATIADPRDPRGSEIEIINERGTLVQAVLWCGRLAFHSGLRTATRLDEGETISYTAAPTPIPATAQPAFTGYLLVPDPAIERAGLTGSLCAELNIASPCPPLGLLTADRWPLPSQDTSNRRASRASWLTAFEILAEMPWREDRIRKWLAAHDGGLIEVKTRGGAVDTDEAQRRLRGSGATPYTVFALRVGTRRIAVITSRIQG